MSKNCLKCNYPNNDGASFCEKCGNKLEEQSRFCASCGSSLESDASFCNKCGAAVNNNFAHPYNNYSYNTNNNSISNLPTVGIVSYVAAGLIILFHVLFFVGFIQGDGNLVGSIVIVTPFITPIIYIIGLVLAIVNKNKAPKNPNSNNLIIVYIILGIILAVEIFLLVSFISSCLNELGNCGQMG